MELKIDIIIDEKTKKKLLSLLSSALDEIKNKTLTRENILKYIIKAEYSEWNDIFIFTVKYISEKIGLPTLQDILKELEKPGLDIRSEAKVIQ